MKYILGTAQFGLDYGVSNNDGKIGKNEILKILEVAIDSKVDYLDTANVYGDAEQIIGNFSELTKNFKLITKTAHTKSNLKLEQYIKLIDSELNGSLEKMKRKSVDVLLFHNVKEILLPNGHKVFHALQEIKLSGLANKIGVSVYNLEELDQVMSKYSVDVIQFPLNVFNQSFLRSGKLRELKDKGIELHARSVFLQGILLMDSEKLNTYFDSIKTIHANYQKILAQAKISHVRGALNFVKQVKELDAIIFGVQNYNQLIEIIRDLESEVIKIDYKDFDIMDDNITNPSLWAF